MNASRAPWVEIGSFDAKEGAEADLFDRLPLRVAWRGVFACELIFRAFEDLDTLRHGFNLETLLNEAFDRLTLFVESQHFPGQPVPELVPLNQRRAVALRYIHDEPGNLLVLIMARVYGSDPDETIINARNACQEICSIFPFDYQIRPIETEEEFRRLTGVEIITGVSDPRQMSGIERFEGLVDAGPERIYLSGGWSSSLSGCEQICRALAGMETGAVYNVTLQPVIIPPEELSALHSMSDLLEKNAQQVKAGYARQLVELASQRCAALLQNSRRAYLGQVRLMSSASLAEYASRAIGFALARQPVTQPGIPGFQIVHPENLVELNRWKNQVLWLTPAPCSDSTERRFIWPRELISVEEAVALFRPPYPLRRQIPGVQLNIQKADGHGEG